jgi:hypothetical protein
MLKRHLLGAALMLLATAANAAARSWFTATRDVGAASNGRHKSAHSSGGRSGW